MGKGLGIAGLIVLIISFFIPLVGTYVTFLALLIVAVGALMGEVAFAIATTVVSGVKVFLLSPTWIAAMNVGSQDSKNASFYATIFFLAVPIVAAIIGATIKKQGEGR